MLPLLKLPSDGKEITIKILEHQIPDPRKIRRNFGEYVIKCCIINSNIEQQSAVVQQQSVRPHENEDDHYYLELRSYIIKEILKECKNNNIPTDGDLKCSVGRVFTIFGKRRINTPKRLWRKNEITHKLEPPMVHIFKLHKIPI